MRYSSKLNIVVGGFKKKFIELAQNPDPMLRTVALAVLPEIKKRVHIEGKDSNGNQIGTYSPSYMKVRTGNYGNSAKFSKGKKIGELKDAGSFSKGSKTGVARPKNNRTADTKVIASLTRQMENDESVLPSGSGYGIGFNNADNFQKSQWVEAAYKKPIWKTTTSEKELAIKVAQDFTNEYLKN